MARAEPRCGGGPLAIGWRAPDATFDVSWTCGSDQGLTRAHRLQGASFGEEWELGDMAHCVYQRFQEPFQCVDPISCVGIEMLKLFDAVFEVCLVARALRRTAPSSPPQYLILGCTAAKCP